MTESIRTRKCPICGTPGDWKKAPSRPFCSERCKLIDLGAWVSGKYAIPGREDGSEVEQEEAEQAADGEEEDI